MIDYNQGKQLADEFDMPYIEGSHCFYSLKSSSCLTLLFSVIVVSTTTGENVDEAFMMVARDVKRRLFGS